MGHFFRASRTWLEVNHLKNIYLAFQKALGTYMFSGSISS
jgi:hypothetical protein